VIFAFSAHAQRPPKVYYITVEKHELAWYLSAAESWAKVVEKDNSDAEAWMNYFQACRVIRDVSRTDWSKYQNGYITEPSFIAEKAFKAIPNTFEYYFIKNKQSFASHNGPDSSLLLKAHELWPSRPEIFSDIACYYETHRELDKKRELCKQWSASNIVSPGILNWNYNVLTSLEPNSILITDCDNDTFGPWILQDALNFRKDVSIFNIWLNRSESYRDKFMDELNMPHFRADSTKIIHESSPFRDVANQMIRHLIKHAGSRKVYIALTVSPEFYMDLQDKTYLTGLAFLYSEKDIDNIAYLVNNFEHNWLLDYLFIDFAHDISIGIVKEMNINYLPAFAKLYEHYRISGQLDKMNRAKTYAKQLIDLETAEGKELFETYFLQHQTNSQ
jgi:hypothetical protein